MFKVVENEDGSTGVYSIDTGKFICSVSGKKKTPGGNGRPIRKERTADKSSLSSSHEVKSGLATTGDRQKGLFCNDSQKGQKISTDVQLGSSSSEYNLRHLSIREENSNDKRPVLPPLPLKFTDEESDDLSDDCITQDDFLRCINLVSHKKLEHSSISDLRESFSLRRISRTTVPESSSTGTEVLENVDISSPMGDRVLKSSLHFIGDEKQHEDVKKYDRFCHSVRSNYDVDGCSTPQLRCRDLLRKYPITFKPQKTCYEYEHLFTFSKKQRKEKYKIACSGLSKRARRLKRLCDKLTVSVKRLSSEDMSGVKRNLKKNNVMLGSESGEHCKSGAGNLHLGPTLKPGVSKGTKVVSVKPYLSSQNIRGVKDSVTIPKLLIASSKSVCAENFKPSYNVVPPYLLQSLPKSLQITPIWTPAPQYLPLNSKNNGTFLKLPSGTFQIKHDNEGKEDISYLDAKRKALSLKKGGGESVACVPLQDVVQKIWKVGDKCFIKGTSIKACGIEEHRENISCLNNIGSIGDPNLSHDHAYHRSPAISSVKPINREPEFGKVDASVRASYGCQTNVLSENCSQVRLSNVNVLLPHKASHTNVMEGALKLPEQRLNQPLSTHILYNAGNILKSVKPKKTPPRAYLKAKSNNKQVGKSIPVIDIADDSPDESNSPKTAPSADYVLSSNGLDESHFPKVSSSVKWIFSCYGCGFECTLKSQDEINEMVLRHMRVYHSVNDPASFLSSYFKSSERAVVTEAFPGYKNSKT